MDQKFKVKLDISLYAGYGLRFLFHPGNSSDELLNYIGTHVHGGFLETNMDNLLNENGIPFMGNFFRCAISSLELYTPYTYYCPFFHTASILKPQFQIEIEINRDQFIEPLPKKEYLELIKEDLEEDLEEDLDEDLEEDQNPEFNTLLLRKEDYQNINKSIKEYFETQLDNLFGYDKLSESDKKIIKDIQKLFKDKFQYDLPLGFQWEVAPSWEPECIECQRKGSKKLIDYYCDGIKEKDYDKISGKFCMDCLNWVYCNDCLSKDIKNKHQNNHPDHQLKRYSNYQNYGVNIQMNSYQSLDLDSSRLIRPEDDLITT